MKNIARLAATALFAIALSFSSAPVTPLDSFETVASVSMTETITVSGSVGIDL